MIAIRKAIAAGVALAAAVGLSLVGASPAAAGTVRVSFNCGYYLPPPWQADYFVTIEAPATAARGQAVTVRTALESVDPVATDTPANYYYASMDVILGGAASGYIYPHGMRNPETKAGQRLRLDGGTTTVTFNTAGEVTYQPVRFFSGRAWACVVQGGGPGPVVATTRVT